MNWGFEDGSAGGFAITRNDVPLLVNSVSTSSTQKHSGTRSLALAVNGAKPDALAFQVDVSLCAQSGSIPMSGPIASAWFYLDLPETAVNPTSYFGVGVVTDGGTWYGDVPPHSTLRQWFQVFVAGSPPASRLRGLILHGAFLSGMAGTVYVDDIVIY